MKARLTVAVVSNTPHHPLSDDSKRLGWPYHWLIDQVSLFENSVNVLGVEISTSNSAPGRELCEAIAGLARQAAQVAVKQTLESLAEELGTTYETLNLQLKRRSNEQKLGAKDEQNTMRHQLRVVDTGKTVVRTGEVLETVYAVVETVDTKQVGFIAKGAVNVMEVSRETFNRHNGPERSGKVSATRRARELGWNAVILHNPTGDKYGNVWSPARIAVPADRAQAKE